MASPRLLYLVPGLCSLSSLAAAGALSVVDVAAPDINCVFDTSCTVVVTDSVGDIAIPGMKGTARLQSRTFTGKAGAPAEGKTGYEYRLDFTQATTTDDASCISDMVIDFGPVTRLAYNKTGPLQDVFVVTKGGLGTIGLQSAVQNGNLITFAFTQPVCAADASSKGQTTFFFGLASASTPKAIDAAVDGPGIGPIGVKARAPGH